MKKVIAAGVLITLFETIHFPDVISQVKLLALVMVMFPIAVIDFRVQKIPNQLLIAALIIRVLIYVAEFVVSVPAAFNILKDDLLGAAVIGVSLLVLLLVFKGCIGAGDIKLFSVIGLYQGLWRAVNSLFFSMLVLLVISFGLLIAGKKSRKDKIPFGPSILLGIIISIGLTGM